MKQLVWCWEDASEQENNWFGAVRKFARRKAEGFTQTVRLMNREEEHFQPGPCLPR